MSASASLTPPLWRSASPTATPPPPPSSPHHERLLDHDDRQRVRARSATPPIFVRHPPARRPRVAVLALGGARVRVPPPSSQRPATPVGALAVARNDASRDYWCGGCVCGRPRWPRLGGRGRPDGRAAAAMGAARGPAGVGSVVALPCPSLPTTPSASLARCRADSRRQQTGGAAAANYQTGEAAGARHLRLLLLPGQSLFLWSARGGCGLLDPLLPGRRARRGRLGRRRWLTRAHQVATPPPPRPPHLLL